MVPYAWTLLLVSCIFTYGNTDLSMPMLHKAFDTEAELIDVTKRYLDLSEKKLLRMRYILKEFREGKGQGIRSLEERLANPLNLFLLTKRLTINWDEIRWNMDENLGLVLLQEKPIKALGTYSDLNSIANAITSIINMQNYEPKDVAKGQFGSHKTPLTLSANDCFFLGKTAFQKGYLHITLKWMAEARKRFKPSKINGARFTTEDIQEIEAQSFYMTGNIKQAIKTSKKLLATQPEHPLVKHKLTLYKTAEKNVQEFEAERPQNNTQLSVYETMCVKNKTLPPDYRLTCRYHGEGYLRLSPYKVEELNWNPKIYMFHEVLSDAEINELKHEAEDKLEEGLSRELDGSHSTWLDPTNMVKKIMSKMEAITGLNVETAEPLEVTNYGPAGFSLPQHDYIGEGALDILEKTGNRIACLKIFMSEEEDGGNTVFPISTIKIQQKKGSALFWFIHNPSGEVDKNVVQEIKIWFHERGQEFTKPCIPNEKTYSLSRYL